jgi:phosphotransferase system HPr (HPr) family protein
MEEQMEIAEKMIVPNSLGLHLRFAAKLVLLVSRYRCDVTVHNGPKYASAKSIIGLVGLGAAKGIELVFTFQGDDAEEACLDVRDFFQNRFNE